MSSSKSKSGTASSSSSAATAAAAKKKELSKKDQQTQSKALAKEQKRKKQEQKALKKEKKKSTKQKQKGGDDDDDDEDIDDDEFEKIVADLLARDTEHNQVTIDKLPEEPQQPRACFSLTLAGTNPQDGFVMYGGEYFDGSTSKCFDELLRFRFLNTAAAVGSALSAGGSGGAGNGEWRRITSPNSPPPRCAHAACITQTHMYIFGGEFSTAWRFHHYNDLWRLDLKTNQWQSLPTLSGPSPRSGCRMVAWKSYLILYGGFYEASRGVRWHDDLYFYDLRNEKWSKAKFATSAQQSPSARSGFQFHVHPNKPLVFLYGGYAKVATSASVQKGRSMDDMWLLHLTLPASAAKSAVQVFPECKWEYLPKKGAVPSKRSGAASCIHKNRLLLFGGVSDTETANDVLGDFHNSLHAFDMDRSRWYELGLKTISGSGGAGGKKGNRRQNQQKRSETSSVVTSSTMADLESNDDQDQDRNNNEDDESENDQSDDEGAAAAFGLRDDAFYVIVNGKFVLVEDDGEDEEEGMAAVGGDATAVKEVPGVDPANKKTDATSAKSTAVSSNQKSELEQDMASLSMKVGSTSPGSMSSAPVATSISASSSTANTDLVVAKPMWNGLPAPNPRISAGICVLNNRLIVYGGTAELGDTQITFDDMWAIDLNKMDSWVELSPGTWKAQQWSGAKEEEEGDDDDDDDSSDDDDEDGEGEEGEEEEEDDGEDDEDAEAEANVRALAEEIKVLRDELGVEDFNTPSPAETMKDFFKRTLPHWLEEMAKKRAREQDDERLSGKELREKAFKLAKRRYDLLSPLLEKLNTLQEAQRLAEEEAAEEARDLAEKMARRKAKKAMKKQSKKE